jgi:transcriptional regulator with XRE-family HTH domain
MDTPRSMSNPEVGDLLGVHFTFASRIRSGRRTPSLTTMVKIRDVFDWSLDDQAKAIQNGTYPALLEQRIDAYAKTQESKDVG